MIRKTLKATQDATFSVDIPHPKRHGMPTPTGTGFFVSPEGLFVTAAHVVVDDEGNSRQDFAQGWLQKEPRGSTPWVTQVRKPTIKHVDLAHDFALLQVDFEQSRQQHAFKDRDGFPFITIGVRPLQEGEPVYSFGYPLPDSFAEPVPGFGIIGGSTFRRRVTSAIVASTVEGAGPVSSSDDVQTYVLDKALNYGNSGGPIVATETGHVHAFCARFQPVYIPQPHLANTDGEPLSVMVPSLYGVVVSLANASILNVLRKAGADIAIESKIAQDATG